MILAVRDQTTSKDLFSSYLSESTRERSTTCTVGFSGYCLGKEKGIHVINIYLFFKKSVFLPLQSLPFFFFLLQAWPHFMTNKNVVTVLSLLQTSFIQYNKTKLYSFM